MGIDLGRFRSKKNDEWLDWLADDPVPASLRARMRQKAVEQASRPVVRRPGQSNDQPNSATTPSQPKKDQNSTVHSVSINIALPKLKKPTLPKKLPKLPKNVTYKQLAISSSVLATVLVVGVIALFAHGGKSDTGNKGVLSASDQKPNFATLTPSDTAKASLQKYDSRRKVATFTDSIGGVDITVSQQPLPDAFKKDTDAQVKKLAEGFSANEVLSTANPTAYLGTDVKGPQTVIFSKNGLLVFILSTKEIDKHDWAEYITNLK